MAATVATMATLNVKCLKNPNLAKPAAKPASFPNLTNGLVALSEARSPAALSISASAIAGAVFSTLATSEPALAAQQIAELAEAGDNRGLALLLPIIPAIGWVLFNILQPALNQLNRMRSSKGLIVGLGLGALGASGFMFSPHAEAVTEPISMIANASAGGDSRGQLLLFVVAPAILWVLYNILQPCAADAASYSNGSSSLYAPPMFLSVLQPETSPLYCDCFGVRDSVAAAAATAPESTEEFGFSYKGGRS